MARIQYMLQHARCLAALWIALILALLVAPAFGAGRAAQAGPAGPFAPDEVLVRMKPGAHSAAVGPLDQALGARQVQVLPRINVRRIRLAYGADVTDAVGLYRSRPEVLYAEPNYRRRVLLDPPNDPSYNNIDTTNPTDPYYATWYQWAPHLLDALGAWSIYPATYYTAATKPVTAPKLAVIDTGLDYTHPDFANAGSSSTDAADGGQIDMAESRSFLVSDDPSDPWDEYGHGTHVAGIAAAAGNNGASIGGHGMIGVGYNAQIMALKVLDASGSGTASDVALAIIWAADHGAIVINLSLGDYYYSQTEQDAIDYAWSKGCLIVAAAGNDGAVVPNYPGACDKVLCVSATSIKDELAMYSNYGEFVGIAAPGGDFDFDAMWFVDVWSALPTYECTLTLYGWRRGYDYLEGTSMATPQVAGLAALYAAYRGITQTSTSPANPPWSSANGNVRMWQTIQRAAEDIGFTPPGGWGPYYGYGRINAAYTLQEADTRAATAGCITGQVRYAGTPVGNAVVRAQAGLYSSEATTRADGMYRVTNVPPGTYSVTATVFGQSQTHNDVPVTAGADTPAVSFLVGAGAGPVLSVEPAALLFQGMTGGPNPAAQQLTISNVGTGTLSWTAADDAGWLSLDSSSGTAPSSVWVSVNLGGLSAGTYEGHITVTGEPGTQNSPQVVTVTLQITSAPLQFTGFNVSPSAAKAGEVVAMSFTASKVLTADPDVTVNGHAASIAGKAGDDYLYQYVVRRDEQEGYAQISISGVATDGSSGSYNDNSSLLVDLTKPTSSIAAMPSWQSALQFAIPFLASDSGSGVAHVLMYYEPYPPDPPADYTLWTTSTNPLGEWTSSPVSFTALGEGFYYFYTRAVDAAGNVEDLPPAATASVGVDRTAPAMTSFTINGGLARTMLPELNLSLAAQDGASGVASMQFYYPGSGGWTTWEPFSGSKRIWVSPEGGMKQVKARCRDIAGNVSPEASASIALYTFADVLPSHWAWLPIEAIRTAGVTSGCSADPLLFCPGYAITRAQVAVFLCRAAGKGPLNRATPTFADVPKSNMYYGYIERLADAASWGGTAPTGGCRIEGSVKYFCPYQPVTREQMSKFLCLAAGKSAAASCMGQFVDVEAGNPFCTFIERLADAGSWPSGPVTVGCACGEAYPPGSKCYCPKSAVTRAEMAVFLSRAFGIVL